MSINPEKNEDFTALRELAIAAAQIGGQTLLEWRDKFQTREKAPADLVTDADLAAQQAVFQFLRDQRPEDCFIGEENSTGDVTPPQQAGRVCWVVDPLDGTTNYVHGFPMYATSVGVVQDSKLLAGAVYDPIHQELFSAHAGGGATLNEQRLQVSEARELSESLVAVSLPPKVTADSPDLAGFVAVVQACRGIRRTGSAALNLSYLAAGRIDAHWAHIIKPWDGAAGVLIATEAGATVSGCSGDKFDVWRADYLAASTPELHAELLGRMS